MALKSRNMMPDTGTNWNVDGDPIEAAGFYGITSGTSTIAVSTQVFVGRVYIMGTLEDTPEKADANDGWFPIKTEPNNIQQTIMQITSDGTTLQYVLNVPGTTNNVFLSIDGVTQSPLKDFTYQDGVLVLTEAVPAEAVMTIRIMAPNFSAENFQEPYFEGFEGNGINTAFNLTTGTVGGTQNVFVTFDGVVQTPFVDFTYSDAVLTFTTAPLDGTFIYVSVYPPVDALEEQDYFVQFPRNASDPDQGNVIISPVYGPRTTTTYVGRVRGNFTFLKAVVDREYLEEYAEDMAQYKLDAVGSISRILVNF